MQGSIKMIVSGVRCNRRFEDTIQFTLVPPRTKDYYGNGYTMNVEVGNAIHYIDVRYSGTVDIEKLARTWIDGFYGKTAQSITLIA